MANNRCLTLRKSSHFAKDLDQLQQHIHAIYPTTMDAQALPLLFRYNITPSRHRRRRRRHHGVDALDAPHPHNNSTRRGWIHLSNLRILASVAIIIVASSASPSCRRQSRIHRCYNQHHNVGEKYKETIRLD